MKVKWVYLAMSILCAIATIVVISYCFYRDTPTSMYHIVSLLSCCVFAGMVSGAGIVMWFDSFLEAKLPPKNV